jgi:hypothetical protein
MAFTPYPFAGFGFVADCYVFSCNWNNAAICQCNALWQPVCGIFKPCHFAFGKVQRADMINVRRRGEQHLICCGIKAQGHAPRIYHCAQINATINPRNGKRTDAGAKLMGAMMWRMCHGVL